MLSLLLFEFVRRETSATVMNATAAVSRVVHRDEKTIRVWRRDFWDNCGQNVVSYENKQSPNDQTAEYSKMVSYIF